MQLTLHVLEVEFNSCPSMQLVHYIEFVLVLNVHDVQLAGHALQTCVVVVAWPAGH